jgi:chromosome segregation ATPase
MTNTNILRDAQGGVNRIIGDLQTLREQWEGVESIDAERAKAEAKLAAAKQNVAGMRSEFAEVKHAHDEILKKGLEKQDALEKLDREIKQRRGELAKINAEFNKIRALLVEFAKLGDDFRVLSEVTAGKLSEFNAAMNKLRAQLGG